MGIGKTAIIIGATGLVGKHLVRLLIADSYFGKVKVFVRRSTGITHPDLQEFIIDFNNLLSIKEEITGDVLFSTLGTTIKQAGSKDAQYLVDFTYQYKFAELASENGVADYFLVSSSGANSKSRMFYIRMKGELDDAVGNLTFNKIRIFRPSLLLGSRPEQRIGELIGSVIINLIKYIPTAKKYRGIKGEEVAHAMINVSKKENPTHIQYYTLDEIFNQL